MHVIILRYAPSFVDGDFVKGTHELVEEEINTRKYDFRKGYCSPFSSEVKLMDYRIKKECVPDFLADLRVVNLNPDKKFVFKDLFKKKRGNLEHHFNKKLLFIILIIKILSKLGVWLKPMNASNKEPEPFFVNTWCYNFFLGVIPDPETEFGEEL
jgi:hypothetical protein